MQRRRSGHAGRGRQQRPGGHRKPYDRSCAFVRRLARDHGDDLASFAATYRIDPDRLTLDGYYGLLARIPRSEEARNAMSAEAVAREDEMEQRIRGG